MMAFMILSFVEFTVKVNSYFSFVPLVRVVIIVRAIHYYFIIIVLFIIYFD